MSTEPTVDDVLSAVANTDDRAATAEDVRIILGCTREQARDCLAALADDGRLECRTDGDAIVWALSDSEPRPDTTDVEPFDGPETDAVSLIEAGEEHGPNEGD